MKPLRLTLVVLFAALVGCGGDKKPTVTIYTSIYENVIADLDPLLEAEFPDIEVEWYQKGSEEVAAKLNSEIAAGRISADIVMTSDPFWYEDLKRAGHLMTYESPHAADSPADLKDPDHAFVTVRVPVMVIGVNSEKVAEGKRPTGFKDLAEPRWANRATMGNPLQSGSTFTTVAALSEKYDWSYFEALSANRMVAAGGNSSVLNRLATGEKHVGIILLENLLKAKADTPELPVEIVYPADGAVLVPSPIAIIATTDVPEAAKKVYDFMLSEAGQRAIVAGNMYSPFARFAPPVGARPWSEIYETALVPWSAEYLTDTIDRRDEIKNRFRRIMLE